jgi:ferritin-like metal-binding protein YciE
MHNDIDEKLTKNIESYISKGSGDHVGLHDIIDVASKAIKNKKCTILNKILPIANPDNGADFF